MQLRRDDCYARDYICFPHNTLIPRVEAESKLPGVCGYPADSKARGPILFGGGYRTERNAAAVEVRGETDREEATEWPPVCQGETLPSES